MELLKNLCESTLNTKDCEAKMKNVVKNGSVEVFTNGKDHNHEKRKFNFSRDSETKNQGAYQS